MSGNPFTDHPHEVGETYFQHMRAAAAVGFRMAAGAMACFVHALLPFLFVRTGSATIDQLHRRIHRRSEVPIGSATRSSERPNHACAAKPRSRWTGRA